MDMLAAAIIKNNRDTHFPPGYIGEALRLAVTYSPPLRRADRGLHRLRLADLEVGAPWGGALLRRLTPT